MAIQPQEIEGVVQQTALVAFGEVGLQLGEIRVPFVDDHHLSINDSLTGNVESGDDP
ncbi:hypothetical protein ACVW1C_002308 [Bradyrhizobium sp. USDA 4011]